MVTDLLSRLTSDIRKEPDTNDVKAKYYSIGDAFSSFDWSQIKCGTQKTINAEYFLITNIRAL